MVYRDERVYAMVRPQWWPRNPGHLLIIPVAHRENIYDLPSADGHAIFDATRLLARAMRTAYECAGVSTRRHNEPAGGQSVWHFHQHLFPRYPATTSTARRRSPSGSPPTAAAPTPTGCAPYSTCESPVRPHRQRRGTHLREIREETRLRASPPSSA